MEFSPLQIQVIERLLSAGFQPISIPPYENALCLRKADCVALLSPVENASFKLLAPVTFLVDGNTSVRLKRPSGEVFVWKKSELPATPARLAQLASFRLELQSILDAGVHQ